MDSEKIEEIQSIVYDIERDGYASEIASAIANAHLCETEDDLRVNIESAIEIATDLMKELKAVKRMMKP